MTAPADWRPSASLGTLKKRAAMLHAARRFFDDRNVLEVETPILSACSVTDRCIESMRLENSRFWLRTSPEYHMKRLLAAGCPDIYQLAKAFRVGESGSRHQPEFTLVEWYRLDVTFAQMITETCDFICVLHAAVAATPPTDIQLHTYRDAFMAFADIDPDAASLKELQWRATGLRGWRAALRQHLGEDRQAWLDFIASHAVYPALPPDSLQVITDHPAEQAMLARLNPEQPQYAERFEVFLNGLELANGFHELDDANEQRQRFDTDNQRREAAGLPVMEVDTKLLEALDHGLPDCCGVAVGIDRVLMLANNHNEIAETISFKPGS